METRFHFALRAQPNDTTCGPTCLQGIYGFWNDAVDLDSLIAEVPSLEEGGTLAVHLANHALRRGYRATIHPYNLQWLDPTWFALPIGAFLEKLRSAKKRSHAPKLRHTYDAYVEFLESGGSLSFGDLTVERLAEPLRRGVPVLTGLSATWLYRSSRENPRTSEDDDLGGQPAGHFVVLCGIDLVRARVLVADPYAKNPIHPDQLYEMPIDRVMNAILLGIVTYDANLLLIEPGFEAPKKAS